MKEVKCANNRKLISFRLFAIFMYILWQIRQVLLLGFTAVAFAVFFGLLGLFLALPLVVVSQVWLRELLVKDILNDWKLNNS